MAGQHDFQDAANPFEGAANPFADARNPFEEAVNPFEAPARSWGDTAIDTANAALVQGPMALGSGLVYLGDRALAGLQVGINEGLRGAGADLPEASMADYSPLGALKRATGYDFFAEAGRAQALMEDNKSAGLQAEKAAVAQRAQALEQGAFAGEAAEPGLAGQIGREGRRFVAGVAAHLEHPAVIGDTVAQSLSYLLPGAALSRAQAVQALSAPLQKLVFASGMGALEGADAAQATREALAEVSEAELRAAAPAYADLVARYQGDSVRAREALSQSAEARALVVSGVIATGASLVTGMAGREQAALGRSPSLAELPGTFARAPLTVAGEGVEEVLQEGGNQFGQNVGVQQVLPQATDLLAGVGHAAAAGLTAGVAQAGALHSKELVGATLAAARARRTLPPGALDLLNAEEIAAEEARQTAELDTALAGEPGLAETGAGPARDGGASGYGPDPVWGEGRPASLEDLQAQGAEMRAAGVADPVPEDLDGHNAARASWGLAALDAANAEHYEPQHTPEQRALADLGAVLGESGDPAVIARAEALLDDYEARIAAEPEHAERHEHDALNALHELYREHDAQPRGLAERDPEPHTADPYAEFDPGAESTSAESGALGAAGGVPARPEPDPAALSAAAPSPLESARAEAATSPDNDRPAPTPAQAAAGNYKKGHVRLHGLELAIENPLGSTRRGVDKDGTPWATTMAADYGYVKRSEGADGDQVDVFLGPAAEAEAPGVFVVDQVDPATGDFDEHKVLFGFDSAEAAEAAYRAHYAPGWQGLGALTPMALPAFKAWLKDGDTRKPLALSTKPGDKPVEKPAVPAAEAQAAPLAGVTVEKHTAKSVLVKAPASAKDALQALLPKASLLYNGKAGGFVVSGKHEAALRAALAAPSTAEAGADRVNHLTPSGTPAAQPRRPQDPRSAELTLRTGERARVTEHARRGRFSVKVRDTQGEFLEYGTFAMGEDGAVSKIAGRANWAMDAVRDAAEQFSAPHRRARVPEGEAAAVGAAQTAADESAKVTEAPAIAPAKDEYDAITENPDAGAAGSGAGGIPADAGGGHAGAVPGGAAQRVRGERRRGAASSDRRAGDGGEPAVRAESAEPGGGDQQRDPSRGGKRARAGAGDDPPAERLSQAAPATGKARAADYRIQPGDLGRAAGEGWKTVAERNVAIVELVKRLEAEGRGATAEEQALLTRFTGWGASEIANGLFPASGYFKPAWEALGRKLKGLMSPEEYAQAARTTQYAHYTGADVISQVYAALGRFGFAGGQVLEPGMGVGLFKGLMPEAMAANSRYTGIEYDGFTAKIAGYLYPRSNILQADYTRQKLPRDFFDLAIGNPPFSKTVIENDPEYKKHRFALHDYFFAKTLDRVRPGGLLAFVTSRYTMDKAGDKGRRYLAERADLLGAIRLPNTAFERNAGTEVVTDILFLRKRDAGDTVNRGEAWLELASVEVDGQPVPVNAYFAKHPAMVLGRHALTGSMYGKNEYTVEPAPGNTLAAELTHAIERLPENVYNPHRASTAALRAAVAERDFNPLHKKEGGLYLDEEGALRQIQDGAGAVLTERRGSDGQMVALKPRELAFLKGWTGLRDALKRAQLDQLNDGDWSASLAALNTAYEAFVKAHGPLLDFTEIARTDKTTGEETVSRRFKNDPLLRLDAEGALAFALESVSEDGRILKGPVLAGRSLAKPSAARIETVQDALMVSLDKTGRLDLDAVASLAGVTREQAIAELGSAIYQAPGGQWQLADEYLSGNVVRKLAEAQAAASLDPAYQRNIDALLAVQPRPLGPSDITVKLGASWLPPQDIRAFAREVLGESLRIDYKPALNAWDVVGRSSDISEWANGKMSAGEILAAVLNNRTITITYTDANKKTHVDDQATEQANAIAGKMREAFRSWVWTDTERAARLVGFYNEHFNNIVPRQFNGEHLSLPGVSLRFALYPHQKRAIWRIIQEGNAYLAHAVGAGKTFTMIAAGMEQKRLGLIKKPIYTVPNHMLAQFAKEFLELYPTANLMVADEHNFHTHNRRRFIAQAALNNPDAIIITHSAFERLGLSEATQAQFVQEQVALLTETLAEVEREDKRTRKRIEQRIEALGKTLEGRSGEKDQVLTFEELGADFLFVDEAHGFRKLDFATNQSNIKGIDPNGSKRAWDLYMKARYLGEKNPGRALVMASGTPITNTLGELYTVQRFFQHELLEEDGLLSFDAWASQYGDITAGFEQDAGGGYQVVSRFAKFVNVPELMRRVRSFMDILTTESLGELVQRPTLAGGQIAVVVTPTPAGYSEYQKTLQERIAASRRWRPSPGQKFNPDPVIKIIGDGRFAALDMRFVDPAAPSDPDSKLSRLLADLAAAYHETADYQYADRATGQPEPLPGAALMLFTNLGLGEASAANRGFDMKAWIVAELTRQGVKPEHIAFIRDHKQHAKKEKLFADLREGRKRILIGGADMETGVNAQKRLHDLFHLDAPWFPASYEQRNGRILRQGNQNARVRIRSYATKGSYDATMYGGLSRKQRFIDQAMMGDESVRRLEDVSEASSFEIAAALASGDPRYLQLAGLKADGQRLERLRAGHYDEQNRLLREKHRAGTQIERDQALQAELAAAIARRRPVSGEAFRAAVNGKTYSERPAFSEALFEAADRLVGAVTAGRVSLGEIGGFAIEFDGTRFEGSGDYMAAVTVVVPGHPDPILSYPYPRELSIQGLAARAANQVSGLDRQLVESQARIEQNTRKLAQLGPRLGAAFADEAELLDKVAQVAELEKALLAESAALQAASEADAEAASEGAPEGPAQAAPLASVAEAAPPVRGVTRAALEQALARAIDPARRRKIRVLQALDEWQGARPEVLRPEGFFDPESGALILVADHIASLERGAWVAWHELYHRGEHVRHGRELDAWLARLRANPSLRALAEAVRHERKLPDTPAGQKTALQEAAAELFAADKAGDFAALQARYGVNFPVARMGRWRELLARFAQFLRELYAKVVGTPAALSDAAALALLRRTGRAAAWDATPDPVRPAPAPLRARSLDQLLTSVVKAPRLGPSALVAVFRALAENPRNWVSPKSAVTDLETLQHEFMPDRPLSLQRLAEFWATREDGRTVDDAPALMVMGEDGFPILTVHDADAARPYLEIGNQETAGKGLSALYQAGLSWAHNNGKTLRPDPGGLSVLNRLRRSEAMIASALRHDTTRHLEPHPDQYVGLLPGEMYDALADEREQREKGGYILGKLPPAAAEAVAAIKAKLWTPIPAGASPAVAEAISQRNLHGLLMASAFLAARREPAIMALHFGTDGKLYVEKAGEYRELGADELPAYVAKHLAPPLSGVGSTTLLRGALALSTLRGPELAGMLQRLGRGLEPLLQARERLDGHAAWGGLVDDEIRQATDAPLLAGSLYSLAPPEPSESERALWRQRPHLVPNRITQALEQFHWARLRETLRHKQSDWSPAWLAAIPRTYLRDFARGRLRLLMEKYEQTVRRMDARKNARMNVAAEIVERLGLYNRRHPAGGELLAQLMHDTTIAGFDPSLGGYTPLITPEQAKQKIQVIRAQAKGRSGEGSARFIEKEKEVKRLLAQEVTRARAAVHLIPRWAALDAEGQALYQEVREAYREHRGLVLEALEARLEKQQELAIGRLKARMSEALMAAPDAEARARQAAAFDQPIRALKEGMRRSMTALREEFESATVTEPYFPLQRYGNYFAGVYAANANGDLERESFHLFETAAAQAAFVAEAEAQGKIVRAGKQLEIVGAEHRVDGGFVAEVMGLLDEGASMLGDAVRKRLQDEVYQLYLHTLPELSMRRRYIHRKKTAGYSAEAVRNLAHNLFHGAHQLARLEYTTELEQVLDLAQEQARLDKPRLAQANREVDVVNEWKKRHQALLNPTGSPTVQAILSMVFFFRLTAPASGLVNLTQTWQVGLPVLSARLKLPAHQVAAELAKASGLFLRGRGHIETVLTDPDEIRAIQALTEAGVLDKTQAHDLAGVGEGGAVHGTLWKKTLETLGWIQHSTERANREATALAAYRLARAQGQAHEQALALTEELTWRSHFDYSFGNRPRLMQSDPAKVMLQFKNYSINMAYLLARDFHDGYLAKLPAEERRAARREFVGMLGMTFLLGGAKALPLWWAVSAVLALVLGDDDEELFEPEDEVREWVYATMGETLGRTAIRGVPDGLGNLGLSDRISLNELFIRSPDAAMEARDLVMHYGEQLMGPAWGVAKSFGDGYGLVHDGETWRGGEAGAPAPVKAAMRGARYFMEGGAYSLTGEEIQAVGPGGVLLQGLGFTPADLADQYARNRALKGARQQLQDRKQRLVNDFLKAWKADKSTDEALAAIADWNGRWPALAISADSLERAIKAKQRAGAETEDGLRLGKRYEFLRAALAGAAAE